jgi:RNA-binding protein
MKLDSKRKRLLTQQAHKLNPVVLIGSKGLTGAVHLEIDRALEDHELIKIRLAGVDREHKDQLIITICQQHQAELIKKIGHIATIYRQRIKK